MMSMTTRLNMTRLKRFLLASASVATVATSAALAQDAEVSDDVIEVTGIRASLERSSDLKRRSGQIVDAITSEELGKFPDINVAESLQRVTGVAITRTRGGEGQFVTVRGLGEEFNAVTYNGRLLATENNGREFSFDVIASELISAAEVFKSPSAEQGDGSLGGRVNIRTARPLDGDGLRVAGSIAGQYEELADEWGPRASGVVSYADPTGTWGVTASVSYQDRDNRTDIAESTFLIENAQVGADGRFTQTLDADGDGLDPDGVAVATPTTENSRFNGFAPSVSFQQRERIGGTFALQYRPDDTTDIVFDVLYTDFDSPGQSFGYSFFPSIINSANVGVNGVVNEFNQIVAGEVDAFSLDLVARETAGEAETVQIGLNVEKIISDQLTLTGDVSYSDAEGNRDNFGSAGGSGTFFVLGFPENARYTFDASGGLSPNATFAANNVAGDASRTSIENLTAEDIRLHFARRDSVEVEDEIVSLRGDAKWEFDESSSLKVGLDYVFREKSNLAFNNVSTQCVFCGYATAVAENSPGLVSTLLRRFDDDFLEDARGNFPRVFPIFSVADLEQAYADAGQADALIPVFDPDASSVVEEIVYGGYFQVDLSGEFAALPYDLNFGVRVAQTELESSGSSQTIDGITQSTLIRDDGSDSTSNQEFAVSPAAPVTFHNDYFDVLPSVNLALDLTNDWKLRVGASRSLSRPTLTDLATQFSITSTNPGGEQITTSNPSLEAIRSNNFDASLEWYGERGSAFSLAVFYKDLTDFVTSTVLAQSVTIPQVIRENDGTETDNGMQDVQFLVAAPRNGDSAEVYGLELGGQYLFENGFGLSGNVTLADSEATSGGETSQLENISDVSWNASAFYEAHGIQARVSVNSRSDYLIGQTVEGGLDEFADDFLQVDLSVGYDINENFSIFLEGINVNDEEVVRISEFPSSDFLEAVEDNGERWVVGLRGSL